MEKNTYLLFRLLYDQMDTREIYYFETGFWLEICLSLWHMNRFSHYNLSTQKRYKELFNLQAISFPNDQSKFSVQLFL